MSTGTGSRKASSSGTKRRAAALVCVTRGFPRHVWLAVRAFGGVVKLDYRMGEWNLSRAKNFAAFKKEEGDTFVWLYGLEWRRPAMLLMPTCVGLAKSVLGIRNPFVLTAGQLKRWLVRHGGEVR